MIQLNRKNLAVNLLPVLRVLLRRVHLCLPMKPVDLTMILSLTLPLVGIRFIPMCDTGLALHIRVTSLFGSKAPMALVLSL